MVTLKDVAQASGVGVATASLILNTPTKASRFREETVQRVNSAARRLNYTPNYRARIFRGGATRAIGIALESFQSHDLFSQPYWGQLISGLHYVLQAHDNQLVLISPTHETSAMHIGLRYMGERRIDALILTEVPRPEDAALLRAPSGPFVMLGRGEQIGMPHIYTDDMRGVELALDHFAEQGHQDVLWLGPQEWYDQSAERRASAFAMACMDRGLQGSMCRFHFQRPAKGVEPLMFQARQALLDYCETHPRPTAVLCYNGDCAVGVYRALNTLRCRIPDDCSVISFDTHLQGYLEPALTTINLRENEMGELGARRLLEHLAEKPGEPMGNAFSEVLEPELVVAESVARIS